MSVQANYPSGLASAFLGMIVSGEPNTLISREIAGGAVGFGVAVRQGPTDYSVAAATTDADVVRGITVRDQSASDDQFAIGDSALVMVKGVIWATAFDSVQAGQPVHMRVAGGAGQFTETAASNLAIDGAIFDTSAEAGELVAIRLG